MESVNYIAKLNEYAHKERLVVKYEDVASDGPDHIKTFTVRAVLNGKAYPDGVGKNKKEAKQNAAKNALNCLLNEPPDPEKATETCPPQAQLRSINYTSWLNEYGQKHRLLVRADESTKLGSNNASQWCRFVVGGREYPGAPGKTKKEAKEEAAKLVYQEIVGSESTDTGEFKDSGTSSLHQAELDEKVSSICDQVKAEDSSFVQTNFVGIVNHYCQQTKRTCSFIEDKRLGPSHNPTFFYKLLINDKEYPVGEGKNIKEAKQNAAQLAWSALKEQSDFESKVSIDSAQAKQSPSTSTQDSGPAKSSSETISDSIVFTDTSSPPKNQVQSPDVKPKIRLAANFHYASDNSKEKIINFKTKEERKGSTQIEKRTTEPVMSRFTSDYDSIERLDKGTFGQVFKARHKLEEKFYAVKIVRCKETVKKALREVKVLSDLNHCNIVRYHSCWIEDSGYQWDSSTDSTSASQCSTDSPVKYLYIQMELCDAKTLRVWIDEKNIQNPKKSLRDFKRKKESLDIVIQIVSGVNYIHSKMLIHRDLKPANIMFDRNGEVKIGDFGLVTEEIEDDAENLVDRSKYKGTPSYMAPEQRSKILYDRKVDIFALGLIYFELLWNLPTVHEKNEIWKDVRNQKLPQAFSQYFLQESEMIKLMLCFKPEERPEASKLKSDLKELLISIKTVQRDSKTF